MRLTISAAKTSGCCRTAEAQVLCGTNSAAEDILGAKGLVLRKARELLDNSRDSGYTGRLKKTEIYAKQRGIKGRCLYSH